VCGEGILETHVIRDKGVLFEENNAALITIYVYTISSDNGRPSLHILFTEYYRSLAATPKKILHYHHHSTIYKVREIIKSYLLYI
jgi:hypothetical protein